jgi:hypothetical protein
MTEVDHTRGREPALRSRSVRCRHNRRLLRLYEERAVELPAARRLSVACFRGVAFL